jgi:thiamine biosynthesis lipoprotein
MGTTTTVVAPGLPAAGEEALAASVAEVFAASERRYSRFREDSELSRLNRSAGPVVVSAPLFEALRRARAYFEITSGLFDPAVGASLAALGYERSFAPGALDRAAPPADAPPARFSDVGLDPSTRTVVRPPHVKLDLGGLIKGHTADRAARRLPPCAAVDAGGDAVLRGAGPEGGGWLVDVEDPRDPDRVLLTLRVRDRAVATSAPNRRRWKAGGREQHHLVDPRTRRPAESDLAQVTVLAPAAEVADVMAKTVFFLGARDGRRFLSRFPTLAGVLIGRGGDVQIVGEAEVAFDA